MQNHELRLQCIQSYRRKLLLWNHTSLLLLWNLNSSLQRGFMEPTLEYSHWKNLWEITPLGNSLIKDSIGVSPLYLVGSTISVLIHLNAQVIQAHFLVDTSCSLCCQLSRLSFESDAHELMLLQLSTPSAVELT